MATKKKVLILLGSPRKKGNSALLAAEAAQGAKAAGAEVETVYLQGLEIEACTGCDACQKKNAKGCVIADDMRALYPKLQTADALLLATPVYWFTMSAQMKLWLDRCYALITPSGHAFAGKKIGIAVTYGAPDVFSSGAVNVLRTFQDAFNFIGAKIVGMVYGTAWKPGDVKKNRALLKEARELGKSLAT
ncbi:MAG TPA: flavodoxin family protein [Planctomycetota bacterium]|mgnify:CR=1 FL=1|nr:flavodoxin family protein [Planctomycetota bacterium]HRR79848.1 flavodoxin family protein [Planctomycetota bacterium]HRT92924.1 flavodoxin family protein [Planctomycetota bacterium]